MSEDENEYEADGFIVEDNGEEKEEHQLISEDDSYN